MVRWTAEVVEFFGPYDNQDRIVDYAFETDNPGLQQVYDAVVELGITDPVVPMWLPEGYELTEFEIVEYPAKTRVHSRFICDGEEIVYYIDIYNADVSRMYQTAGAASGKYEYGGVTHVIMNNNDKISVVWEREEVECSMSMDVQEDTLVEILKSIYIGRKTE